MAKKEKVQRNNFGERLVMAPAVMLFSLGLCLVCLVYLNNSNSKNNLLINHNVLGVQEGLKSTEITNSTEKDISFWSQIVEENPTYRDGWIRLAVGLYEGGEIDRAIEALDKAKEIDPNSQTIKSLEKIIQR